MTLSCEIAFMLASNRYIFIDIFQLATIDANLLKKSQTNDIRI